MRVHLLDGTYELFRHYYALPSQLDAAGREVAATRGVVRSVMGLLAEGATHLAVATDHIIESFRNRLWPDYKDSTGVPDDLLSQFQLVEDALRALGVTVWPMVEHEADDALAAGAALAAADPRVSQVIICTPDKDLAQCVTGERVVLYDRRRRITIDEAGVIAKYGVAPASIPDWLALVGDEADGYPGLPGWGARTSAAVLARYGHIERIPLDPESWDVSLRGAPRLAATLAEQMERALLFRRLATLVRSAPVSRSLGELAWRGPTADFPALCETLEAAELAERAIALAAGR